LKANDSRHLVSNNRTWGTTAFKRSLEADEDGNWLVRLVLAFLAAGADSGHSVPISASTRS